MNHRLEQLKTAAENIAKNDLNKFSEIYGLLIFNEIMRILNENKKNMPGEVHCSIDATDGWQMSIATLEIKLREYFNVK